MSFSNTRRKTSARDSSSCWDLRETALEIQTTRFNWQMGLKDASGGDMVSRGQLESVAGIPCQKSPKLRRTRLVIPRDSDPSRWVRLSLSCGNSGNVVSHVSQSIKTRSGLPVFFLLKSFSICMDIRATVKTVWLCRVIHFPNFRHLKLSPISGLLNLGKYLAILFEGFCWFQSEPRTYNLILESDDSVCTLVGWVLYLLIRYMVLTQADFDHHDLFDTWGTFRRRQQIIC